MKTLLLLTLTILLTNCAEIKTIPDVKEKEETKSTASLRQAIYDVVEKSTACSKRYWKNRGIAPMAYMKGMAIMYAKQVCGQGSKFIEQDKIRSTFKLSWENFSRKHTDGLEFYGLKGSALNTYTFLIGLGMRESSGRYCEGRDMSAGFAKDYSAEAGVFQSAYVDRLFNSELAPLYKKYQNGELNCELEVFSKGVTCKDHNKVNHGNGDGVAFQKLTKQCPALNTQWAAITMRSWYTQFYPIKHKESEFRLECRDMLMKVENLALKNCGGLK